MNILELVTVTRLRLKMLSGEEIAPSGAGEAAKWPQNTCKMTHLPPNSQCGANMD